MKGSAALDIRVLDHPLERKNLDPFTGPGVYIFVSEAKEKVEGKITSGPSFLNYLQNGVEVCYVGKAKRLNQRLLTYRVAAASAAGDWYKSNKLSQIAKSVVVVQTPTHFEACLLELLLIRILDPKLNYMSTRPGRLYYIQQNKTTHELAAVTRRRVGYKTWGCMRVRSELRLALSAFQEILEFFDSATGELNIRPADSASGRLGTSRRMNIYVSEKHRPSVRALLLGKKIGIMEAIWQNMRAAALQQQFHHAAQLRDLFLALRQMQVQLRRSRRIMRRFRSLRILVRTHPSDAGREYFVHRYGLRKVAVGGGKSAEEPGSFAALMESAISVFGDEQTKFNDSERLRVNFEFLRLMLWWLDNQPEDCTSAPVKSC